MKKHLTFAVLILYPLSIQADQTRLEHAARLEGSLSTLAMPDHWANWQQTWSDLSRLYHLSHQDTDMTSGQAIAKMRAEKKHASADMSDVGVEFAIIASAQKVTQAYQPSTWDQIPDWAKDSEGHWMMAYTGTIAFIINRERVRNIPRSWKELLTSEHRVSIGEVGSGNQPTSGVLAAAIAMGGGEDNITPGIHYFSQLAKQNRLSLANPVISNLEKGEVEVGILWDFNALNYRALICPERFEVLIPSDGSVIKGYSTIINRYARHPNAARLAREYILSDAGQINLARGFARPIRPVTLPEDVKKYLLPDEQYRNARPVQNHTAWRNCIRELPLRWQEEVIIHMQ